MMALTPKQAELLDFIIAQIDATGIAPTFEEMKNALGVASKSNVHRLIIELERRGHITRSATRARSIALCSDLEGWPDEALVAELTKRGWASHKLAEVSA